MTLDDHPIIRWISVASLVAGIGGGAWFIMDERERSIEQTERLSEIRREQEDIRRRFN